MKRGDRQITVDQSFLCNFDGLKDEWIDGWMDVWTDGKMDGWMDFDGKNGWKHFDLLVIKRFYCFSVSFKWSNSYQKFQVYFLNGHWQNNFFCGRNRQRSDCIKRAVRSLIYNVCLFGQAETTRICLNVSGYIYSHPKRSTTFIWSRKYYKTGKQEHSVLTLYAIDTHFNASTTDTFWKHCEKRRNCP